MLSHGITDLKFNSSIVKKIPKDMKMSLDDSDNYRAIAISTTLTMMICSSVIMKMYQQIYAVV